MVDKIQKVLDKLSEKEKEQIKKILKEILDGHLAGYDIKKLKGHQDIYRIRKGRIRIIYQQNMNGIFLLAIERRSDTTYNL